MSSEEPKKNMDYKHKFSTMEEAFAPLRDNLQKQGEKKGESPDSIKFGIGKLRCAFNIGASAVIRLQKESILLGEEAYHKKMDEIEGEILKSTIEHAQHLQDLVSKQERKVKSPEQEVLDFHKKILDLAKKAFFDGSDLSFAHVVTGDGESQAVACRLDGDDSKDTFASFVKSECQRKNAKMIGFVTESWVIKSNDRSLAEKWKKEKHKYKHMGEFPGATECICISVESREQGRLISMTDILPERKLGETVIINPEEFSGRFQFL